MANIVYTYITKLSAVEKHRYLYLCRMHNIFFLQIDTSILQILYWLLHHTDRTVFTTKTNNTCISIDKDPAVYTVDKPDWIKANICLIDFFFLHKNKNLHSPEKSLKFGYSKLICKNMSWEGYSANKKTTWPSVPNCANDLINISQLFLCLLV